MRKKILIIILSVVISSLVIFQGVSIIIYNAIFNHRYESATYLMSNMDDFENLERTRFEFNTKNDKKLVGYLYSTKGIEEKGLVVFAHGLGGGGQIGYLEIFNYLTQNGYYVFAYDATANDESEGKVVGGLPQGIIDLDYAINFTKTIPQIKDLPLMLMGFSWGAYSVSNVLNYQENVKGVVAISGWNESLDLVGHYSNEYAGQVSKMSLPFVRIYETIKYGKYASSNAMDAFEKTNAKIMIVHSEDDKTVPIEYGYNKYYEQFKNDDRFIFKHYENRGHGNVFYSKEGAKYYNSLKDHIEQYIDSKNNITQEEIVNFANQITDRNKLSNLLDYEMFDEIIEFYNSCL